MNDALLTSTPNAAGNTAASGVSPDASPVSSSAMPLRVNFAWTIAGSVFYQACLFGIAVVIAKIGNPDTFGRWSMAIAVSGPILVFAGLNARALQASDPRSEFSFADYFGLRIVMVSLGMIVVLGAATLTEYATSIGVVLALSGIAKSVESLCDVFYGEMQRHEQMKPIAVSMTLKGVLSLVAFSIGLAVGGLELATLGLALAWTGSLLAYDWPRTRAVRGGSLGPMRFDPVKLTALFRRTLPLGIAIFLVTLTVSVPRGFIERERGYAELGIYSALAYLMNPGAIIVNALGQSATPRLARLHADGDVRGFLMLFGKMTLLALGLALAGLMVSTLIGGPILRIVFRPEYAQHVDLLLWLMVAAGLEYLGSVVGYALTAARVLRSQVPLFAIVCGGTALGCWLWVGPYGPIGAAWAMIAARSVQLLGSFVLLAVGVPRRRPA
jgi:O-antigen/teichoic acid export membrane protein